MVISACLRWLGAHSLFVPSSPFRWRRSMHHRLDHVVLCWFCRGRASLWRARPRQVGAKPFSFKKRPFCLRGRRTPRSAFVCLLPSAAQPPQFLSLDSCFYLVLACVPWARGDTPMHACMLSATTFLLI
jgi:hypothetical protein